MCWEHSNVNFGHQGVPLASQHDGGATYVCTMSVQSFQAVASIVWVEKPKITIVLGLDHPYACLNWNILTETSSIVLCLNPVHFLCFVKILVHFLSPFHTKKSPPKLHKQLQKFYKVVSPNHLCCCHHEIL